MFLTFRFSGMSGLWDRIFCVVFCLIGIVIELRGFEFQTFMGKMRYFLFIFRGFLFLYLFEFDLWILLDTAMLDEICEFDINQYNGKTANKNKDYLFNSRSLPYFMQLKLLL
jgi:hypothetical protein